DQWHLSSADGTQTTIKTTGYELRIAWGKLIFSWWDSSHSQSWRVTSYEISDSHVRLQAVRGIAQTGTSITLTSSILTSSIGAVADSQYRELLRRNLLYVGYRIRACRMAGPFLKLVAERKHRLELFVAVDETQSQARIDSSLVTAIRWLSRFNQFRPADRRAHRLTICVPVTKSLTLRQRLGLLSTEHLVATISCLELHEHTGTMTTVAAVAQQELLQAPPGRLTWPHSRTPSPAWHDRICSLSPDFIEVRPLTRGDGRRYLVNGLEFACLTR